MRLTLPTCSTISEFLCDQNKDYSPEFYSMAGLSEQKRDLSYPPCPGALTNHTGKRQEDKPHLVTGSPSPGVSLLWLVTTSHKTKHSHQECLYVMTQSGNVPNNTGKATEVCPQEARVTSRVRVMPKPLYEQDRLPTQSPAPALTFRSREHPHKAGNSKLQTITAPPELRNKCMLPKQ